MAGSEGCPTADDSMAAKAAARSVLRLGLVVACSTMLAKSCAGRMK